MIEKNGRKMGGGFSPPPFFFVIIITKKPLSPLSPPRGMKTVGGRRTPNFIHTKHLTKTIILANPAPLFPPSIIAFALFHASCLLLFSPPLINLGLRSSKSAFLPRSQPPLLTAFERERGAVAFGEEKAWFVSERGMRKGTYCMRENMLRCQISLVPTVAK